MSHPPPRARARRATARCLAEPRWRTAGIRAAVEDNARESAASRHLAELGRDHIGCEYLHAALHDCRPFQPDLCRRQRHRKPVLDAPFRRDARGGDRGVSRGISGAMTRMVSLTTPEPGPGRGEVDGEEVVTTAPSASRALASRFPTAAVEDAELPRLQRHRPRQHRLRRLPQRRQRRRPRSRQVNGGRHHSRRMRRHKARGPGCSGPPASSMR